MKDNKRKNWIDIAKGIGIILVIAEHWFQKDLALFSNLVCSFHMPLFFVLGGVLYKELDMDVLIVRRFKSILMPYFIFACIDLLIQSVLQIPSLSVPDSVVNILSLRRAGWFVVTMVLTVIIFNALHIITKGNKKSLLILISAMYLIGMYASYYSLTADENIIRTFVCLLFYYVGYLLGDYKVDERIKNKSTRGITLLISSALLVAGALWENDYMVLMYDSDYGNPVIFTIKATLGSLAVTGICIAVNKFRVLEKVGQYTLYIMLLQFPVYMTLKFIYGRLVGNKLNAPVNCLMSVLCIAIVTLVSYIGAKVFSKGYNRLLIMLKQ